MDDLTRGLVFLGQLHHSIVSRGETKSHPVGCRVMPVWADKKFLPSAHLYKDGPPGVGVWGEGGIGFSVCPVGYSSTFEWDLLPRAFPPKREQQTNQQSTLLAYGPTQQYLEGCGAGPGRAKHVKYLERAGARGGSGYPVGGGLGVPLGNWLCKQNHMQLGLGQ
jgi:hypothetical protein